MFGGVGTKVSTLFLGTIVSTLLARTLSLSVPCCPTCGANVRWYGRGGMGGFIGRTVLPAILMLLLGALLGGILNGLLAALIGLGQTAGTVVAVATMSAVVGLWLIRRYRQQAPTQFAGHACSRAAAVRIRDFDANTTSLEFLNPSYGQQFAAINQQPSVAQSTTPSA
jgi:hypothetical protein